MLMSKERAAVEVLNDRDDEIVTTLRVVRDDGDRLEWLLRRTPFADREYRLAYEPATTDVERARRCIVKSMMGMGADSIHRQSGFRKYPHNRARLSDTTCANEWQTYADCIGAFAVRLAGVLIDCGDALDVMRTWDSPETLMYLDPPYPFATRVESRNRYAYELGDADHEALLGQVVGVRSMVVLSGYRCALYDEVLAGWERTDIETRGKTESVWRNAAACAAMEPTLFDSSGVGWSREQAAS